MADILGNAGAGASLGATLGTAVPGIGTAVGAVAGAGIGAAAGLIGYLIEQGANKEAAEILKSAQEAYGKVDDTSVMAAAKQVLGPTKLASIQTDPAFAQAQDEALSRLGQISENGGFTLADRARLNEAQDATAAGASSANRSMLAGLSRRGMAGTGAELAASLAGQQDAANRISRESQQIAGRGEERALRALMDRAQLAGTRESNEYSRKVNAANAQDAIDRFNNTAQYNRATDDYARRLGKATANVGFAGQNARNTQAVGQQQGQYARDVGGGLRDAALGIGSIYDQYNAPAPSHAQSPATTEPAQPPAPPSYGGEDDDPWSAR